MLATWKKDPATEKWCVYCPGGILGQSVTVVAKSGTAKQVKLTAPHPVLPYFFSGYTVEKTLEGTYPIPVLAQPVMHPAHIPSHVTKAAKKKIPGIHYPKPVTPKPASAKHRTQKARGVVALAKAGWHVPAHRILDAQHKIISSDSLLGFPLPAFCRPCPPTAQHGFVDSRVVKTPGDVEAVRQETIAHEPDAELMLMPFLDGGWSAIVTPAGISIGPGHDAATGGHGDAVAFILTDAKFNEQLLASATIAEDHMPYCEVVEHAGEAYAVQLRNGPVIPRAKNYIPRRVPVCKVVDARPYTDLLDWQKVAATLDPKTTVVICADLMCHQAAHCSSKERQIAVVTDGRELKPGMILNPEPMPPPDVEAFWQGLHYAMPKPDTEALRVGLLALHQQQFLLQTAPGARLAGMACRTFVGLSAIACHGEARYMIEKGLSRHAVYTERYADGETDVHFLEEVFSRPGWSSSIGGKNWVNCTLAAVGLRDAVRACLAVPSEETVSNCIDSMNTVVNVSHNTSKFLANKFGSAQEFDLAAHANAMWIAQHVLPAVWTGLTASVPMPMGKDRKVLRSEAGKKGKKGKPPVTWQVRARLVNGQKLRVQFLKDPATGQFTERDFDVTPQVLKAWDATGNNAVLNSLAHTGATYVPCFVRPFGVGRTLCLVGKSEGNKRWYVSTGIIMPADMTPLTKKEKAALKAAS